MTDVFDKGELFHHTDGSIGIVEAVYQSIYGGGLVYYATIEGKEVRISPRHMTKLGTIETAYAVVVLFFRSVINAFKSNKTWTLR